MKGILAPDIRLRTQHYMWGGGGYIFSRDVIQAFVDHSASWNHGWMEDVAMSVLAEDIGITLDGTGLCCSINKREHDWLCITHNSKVQEPFEFTDFKDVVKASDQWYWRVKCDLRRHIDGEIMRQLKFHLVP